MKAKFTLGIFGVVGSVNSRGEICILVNVRTDQEKQLKAAGLPIDSAVKIIDLPGGGVELEDFPVPAEADLLDALRREVVEETGCSIKDIGNLSSPFVFVTNNQNETEPAGDLAFWAPIKIVDELQLSDEASEHPWITLRQLVNENRYRCPGRLGIDGRMGRMIREAFEFFRLHPEYLSWIVEHRRI